MCGIEGFDTAGRLGVRPQKRHAESPPAGLPEEFIFRGYGISVTSGSPVGRSIGPPVDRPTPDVVIDGAEFDELFALIEELRARLRRLADR